MTTATAAADAVMAALAAEPATVAELSQRAGLGHSTTGKALVALERDNRVRRLSGGRDQGRRRPDRWVCILAEICHPFSLKSATCERV
jgi:hypothetical protein